MRDRAFERNGGHRREKKAKFQKRAWLEFLFRFKLKPK